MRSKLILPALTGILLPSAALAQTAPDSEQITIAATRLPTPVDETGSSVTIITGDDIAARQERTLPDVLKDVPGLNVVQSGGPGGTTSVFLRGANSNHTKVLIDGIDISDPSTPTGAVDFAHILTGDIARVEVLRGPQSGLYGSDAIGGVIDITTKKGSGPAQFTGSVEGGSFDTLNETAGARGATGAFHYALDFGHYHSGATPVTPLDLLAPGEARHDDGYDNYTTAANFGFDVTHNFDLGFTTRYINSTLKFTGEDFDSFPAVPAETRSTDTTEQIYSRAFGHLVLFDGAFDQTLGVSYGNSRSTDLDPGSPLTTNRGERFKLDWQGNIKIADGETLTLGAEHQRDDIKAPIAAHIAIDSGYAQIQSVFGPRFFNTVSLRYDDNDHFGDKLTYRVAPAFLISETGTRLKGSIGTGFKAPSVEELFQDFPAFNFFANPNLKPETSFGYEAGFEQDVTARIRFGATYFHNDIKNLISDNASFTSEINVGRAVTQGLESFIAYQPLETLSLRADYTLTEADDSQLHQELLRRPRNKATLGATWQATEKLSLSATALFLGSWVDGNRDFSVPRLKASGYGTADLAASYDLDAHFQLFARLTNLLDQHYEDPDGYLRPGRGVFIGIRAQTGG